MESSEGTNRRGVVRRNARIVVTVLGCAWATFLFARLLASADLPATWRAMASAGPLLFLAPAPFALTMGIDTLGAIVVLRALGARATFAQLFPVRVASEALHLSVPAGFVAADAATAVLLESRADVPLRDGFIACVARRWLTMRAHGVYICLAAIGGFSALRAMSPAVVRGTGLPWIVLGSALVPFLASWSVGEGLLGRSTFTRFHDLVSRFRFERLARWAAARRNDAVATDGQVARLRRSRAATAGATLAFLGCWCAEALESAFLLHLLGIDVGLAAVASLEAAVTLLRSVAVIAPSGLGFVDVGYAAAFSALGADPGGSAAFVLLKRAKELVWVVIGYAALAGMRGRSVPAAAAPAPSTAA